MNWRERLDARIDTCPECDQWRWDGHCGTCEEPVDIPAIPTVEAA